MQILIGFLKTAKILKVSSRTLEAWIYEGREVHKDNMAKLEDFIEKCSMIAEKYKNIREEYEREIDDCRRKILDSEEWYEKQRVIVLQNIIV